MRIRRRRGGVQIEWFVIKAQSPKGQMMTKHIKKGQRAKIPKRHYEHHCQDWEACLVEEIEERLAPIRRQLSHITSGIVALKALIRGAEEPAGNEPKAGTEEPSAGSGPEGPPPQG